MVAMEPPVRACIFDLDGTLVDAFQAHFLAYREAFSELGVEIGKEEFVEGYGKSSREIIEMLLEKHSLDADWRELHSRKRELFSRYLSFARLLPGVRELLERLGGMKTAIATSASRGSAEEMLEEVRLDFPGPLITADHVKRAKPDPEIFLLASEKLGTPPGECAVFEDSLHGVEAAKRAAMRVVGVLTGKAERRALEKAGAELVVDDMERGREEILQFLGLLE